MLQDDGNVEWFRTLLRKNGLDGNFEDSSFVSEYLQSLRQIITEDTEHQMEISERLQEEIPLLLRATEREEKLLRLLDVSLDKLSETELATIQSVAKLMAMTGTTSITGLVVALNDISIERSQTLKNLGTVQGLHLEGNRTESEMSALEAKLSQ
jgi:hypothetical protein